MHATVPKLAAATRASVLCGAWDQSRGAYTSAHSACCTGAKLAGHFRVATGGPKDFLRGADAFARALGGNRLHVIRLLQQAGAGSNPLSGQVWDLDRDTVWRNLATIETLPRLTAQHYTGLDLADLDIPGADLSGSIFEGCTFAHADLRAVRFDGALLRRCEFRDSRLQAASLRRADLANTRLRGARLQHANLTHASLRYAFLEDSDFTNANVEHADFTGAILTNTRLADARGCHLAIPPA